MGVDEAVIDPGFYRSRAYSNYSTLYSLIEQVRWVMLEGISDVLYVGVGSGFAPAYLRAQGVRVTTADINVALKPDLVCDVLQLADTAGEGSHESIMACEVFEHMPFEIFEQAVQQLSMVAARRVLVTLPVFRRFPLKIGGTLTLARKELPFGFWLSLGKRSLPKEHCWELGSDSSTRLSVVRSVFKRHFSDVVDYRMRTNPYHHVFDLSV